MNRKVAAIAAAVVVALGLGGAALYSHLSARELVPELNASLSPLASLEQPEDTDESAPYDLGSHQTLSRAILLIRENYVDPERVNPYEMFLASLDSIQRTVAEVLIDDSEAPQRIKVAVGSVQRTFELGGLDQLWEVTMSLRDIFRFLQTQLRDPEQLREVEYAAINGMLSTLDPHSVLLKPESFDEVKLSTKGEFGGLGIVISIRDSALTIISPIAGTPASRAGLKAQDKIVRIGEESTVNMGLEEAVHRLRGKPGSTVNVWVLRKGWTEARRFTLTRANIKIESVSSQLLEDGIGYVRVKSFQGNTYDDLVSHLDRMREKNNGELRGLVLDLRNNPGGLLDQAILISDRFIERGPLVITVGEGNKKRDVKSARASNTETAYPIVALVNGGSASASEIVSGALKNHDRALVIGQQTFGKGSVQVLYDFKDHSALKLTIAQYLTPGDVSIQSVGITPDVQIVPAVIGDQAIHLFVDDDAPREKDLKKHLDRDSEATRPSVKPAVRMIHLTQEDSTATEEAESMADEFKVDFEIELARDLLRQAQTVKALDRPALLKQGAGLFEARAAEQENRIAERLKQMGVDWALGQASGDAAAVDARLSAALGQKPLAEAAAVKAGSEITLTATVRNTGAAPLYRVYGVTDSENPLLKNLEFVFGRLDPGAQRSWSVKVKLPKDLNTRVDNITLSLGDAHDKTHDASASTFLAVEELSKPRFEYSLQVDDREKGNGDGVVQVGEEVDLRVDVRNVGDGAAEDALVTVKNITGPQVYLSRGRDKLAKLAVGEIKSGAVGFALREPVAHVKLRVSAWDTELGAPLSEVVELPVAEATALVREKRSVRAEAEAAIYAGAHAAMPVLGTAAKGEALSVDAKVGDWLRVTWGKDAFGFVRGADVQPIKATKRKAGAIVASRGQAAPLIDLVLPELLTNAAAVQLRGEVRDESGLRDMFIFVNDKKVFYRALEKLTPDQGAFRAPLDVSLALQEGANTVAVVVRENDEVISRRLVSVFRRPSAIATNNTPPIDAAAQ